MAEGHTEKGRRGPPLRQQSRQKEVARFSVVERSGQYRCPRLLRRQVEAGGAEGVRRRDLT